MANKRKEKGRNEKNDERVEKERNHYRPSHVSKQYQTCSKK